MKNKKEEAKYLEIILPILLMNIFNIFNKPCLPPTEPKTIINIYCNKEIEVLNDK